MPYIHTQAARRVSLSAAKKGPSAAAHAPAGPPPFQETSTGFKKAVMVRQINNSQCNLIGQTGSTVAMDATHTPTSIEKARAAMAEKRARARKISGQAAYDVQLQ